MREIGDFANGWNVNPEFFAAENGNPVGNIKGKLVKPSNHPVQTVYNSIDQSDNGVDRLLGDIDKAVKYIGECISYAVPDTGPPASDLIKNVH